jgi:hypothetical protein
MSMRIENLEEVIAMFKYMDNNINQDTRTALKVGVKSIAQLAKHYAPVDEGRLEMAIKAKFSGNGSQSSGIISVEGVVDGRDVSEYAAIVHEYEWRKRGPLTRVKGPKAGPRYLSRAIRDGKKQLFDEIEEAVGRNVRNGVRYSGVNSAASRRRRR